MAVRGRQAGREFYNAMCSFKTIYNRFKYNTDPQIPATLKAQRKLQVSRIPLMGNYILNNPKDYILSSITVSVDSKIKFHPGPGHGENGKSGKVFIPNDASILINDGQHRCAAIKYAYEQNPSLGDEKVSVVIFEDKGLKRSQQMFSDLNKHAVKPTSSLGILYDHRNAFSRFIVILSNDVDIFHGRTEVEKISISNRSTKFFTLNGIAEATKYLLKSEAKSIESEKQKLAVNYWDTVSKNIPEWNLLIQKKVTPSELRKNYVHAHTNVLNALGMVGYVLTTEFPENWKQKLKGLQKVNWEKSNPIWEGKIMNDGRMTKTRLGIKQAANEILQHCGYDKTLSEFEAKS